MKITNELQSAANNVIESWRQWELSDINAKQKVDFQEKHRHNINRLEEALKLHKEKK
ncbi:MAG TPA: hypothetical protein VMV86_04480 [Methanosarcinales archaeon]|nr:hypothetical protein [Methanosarcinales archaeon]